MSRESAAVASAIADGLRGAANSTALSIQHEDVQAVQRRVEAEVQPLVENLTNQEPLYKSRVVLGSVAAIVSSLVTMYALWQAGVSDGEVWAAPITTLFGSGFALYGRLVASKPIGG